MERLTEDNLIFWNMKLLPLDNMGFLVRNPATCMTDYLNVITKDLSTERSVISMLLDITKAFCRVSHPRLLNEFASQFIVDPILFWFSPYLSSKNQVGQVNGFTCAPREVSSGVIQGSF